MKAKRITQGKGISINDRKEKGYSGTFLLVDKDFNHKIDCRIYWTATRCYCCLWVSDSDYQSGSGWVGGYGYDKESAAVQEAITNAGYKLFHSGKKRKHCSISGVGREAIESALMAIGRLTTRKKLHMIHTHA